MAEAVAHSTRYLTDKDLGAMASYLKVVPAIKTDDYLIPVNIARLPSPVSDSITYNLIEQKDYLAQAKIVLQKPTLAALSIATRQKRCILQLAPAVTESMATHSRMRAMPLS